MAAEESNFVLRSGVRTGLKREFAFAMAALSSTTTLLGRTRSRTTVSSPPAAAAQLSSPSPAPKRPRPPDPSDGDDDPPPVLALLAQSPDLSPRRITRSMLPQTPLHQPQEEEPTPHRRFTRSLLQKDPPEALSGTTTATSSSSSPSAAAATTSSAKMELKMSKKISFKRIPKNLKDLLATGLLEGQPVKYIMKKGKRAVLRGVIKRLGILCSCSSCKGRNVVSPYYFEVHAGSTKKHPSDYIFLENGNNLHDILRACSNATLDMLESAIQNAIGPAPKKRTFKCQTCKSSFSTLHTGKFALLCDSCLDSKGSQNRARKSKVDQSPTSSARRSKNESPGPKYRNSYARGSKSASPAVKTTSAGRITRKDKGLHKLVFMSGVLPEGTDVGYYVGGKVSPSQFEAHAGRAARRKPYHNIYMSNGVSLHELSVSLSKGRNMSNRQSDDLCSICSDGGELLLCDSCPRAFHRECVGFTTTPKGTWCCRYCENRQQRESCLAYNNNAIAAGRIDGIDPMEQIFTRSIRVATTPITGFGGCALCRLHDFSKKKFSARTVLLCDQCGREFHIGCLKEHNMADLTALPEGAWYCTADCVRISETLKDLVIRGAEPIPSVDAEVIKRKHEEKALNKDGDLDVRWRVLKDKSSADSKLVLSKAVAIFHESFDPIIQIATGRDLIPAMVYGRSVRDQDYTGMHCAVLTVGNIVVSAGLFRVMGSEIAELPLVATSRDSQGLGYFKALFGCIERLLASLKVKHFILPAADEAESIWTQRFGFVKITQDELREYLKGGRTTVFQGTSTLHKLVPNGSASSVDVALEGAESVKPEGS
uniref:PHD-type domain-containing protein n=1 Tax=Leersia perrieri TaxID=77586 RepID=A0A0D9WUF5_9ORYZ